jgi:hypothetical protein
MWLEMANIHKGLGACHNVKKVFENACYHSAHFLTVLEREHFEHDSKSLELLHFN